MMRRNLPSSTNAYSLLASWLMAWIALVIAGVGLLVLLGTPSVSTSLAALLIGAPITLTLIAAFEIELARMVAMIFGIAILYAFFALRMIRQSGFALSCGLGLVLLDVIWGIFVVLGTSGEVPPTLIVFLASVFLAPRLFLLYLISQGLKNSNRSQISQILGVSVANLATFMIDPLSWMFYYFAMPTPSHKKRRLHQQREDSNRKSRLEQTTRNFDDHSR